VPGAGVELAGTYDIRGRKIDMQGNLRMQAKTFANGDRREIVFSEGDRSVFFQGRRRNSVADHHYGKRRDPVMGGDGLSQKI